MSKADTPNPPPLALHPVLALAGRSPEAAASFPQLLSRRAKTADHLETARADGGALEKQLGLEGGARRRPREAARARSRPPQKA